MRTLLVVPLLLASAGALAADRPPSRDQMQVERALAGKVPGKPKPCLSHRESDNMSTHDGRLLYRVSRTLTYVNEMNGCRMLGNDDILITRLYGSDQVCRGDIAEIVDRGSNFPKGSCAYGDFVPYTAAN